MVGLWYCVYGPISGMKPVLSFSKPSGNGDRDWPSSRIWVPPRKASIPARVTMKDGMPMYAIQNPCQAPATAPSSRQRTTARPHGISCLIIIAPAGRADEGDERSDRQVDVPRDDHDHHADREDEDVAVLLHQAGDVAGPQQDVVGPDLEDDDDQGERDQHSVLPHIGPQALEQQRPDAGRALGRRWGRALGLLGGRAHPSSPLSLVMWRIRTSCVASARGTSPVSRRPPSCRSGRTSPAARPARRR